MASENVPRLIKGAIHLDERGSLSFNNKLLISGFQRVYAIQNSSHKPFRGWHGHQLESKIFLTIVGRIRFGAVRVRDWAKPDPGEQVMTAELAANSMDAFLVPGGYANGILSLEPESQALVFSSSSLTDSLGDDFRIAPDFWVM